MRYPFKNTLQYVGVVMSSPKTQKEKDEQADKVLLTTSKGLLVVGAVTSMGFTSVQSYNIFSGMFPEYVAATLTVVAMVFLLFVFDMALGVLAPYITEFTANGEKGMSRNGFTLFAGVLMWLLVLGQAATTISFTLNGADITVDAALQETTTDLSNHQEKTAASLASISEMMDKSIADAKAEDEKKRSALMAKGHAIVQDKIATCKRRKYTWAKTKSHIALAKKDSAALLEKFKPTAITLINKKVKMLEKAQSQSSYQLDVVNTSNYAKADKDDRKLKAASSILRVIGVGSTILFLIITLIRSLLIVGAKKPVSTRLNKGVKQYNPTQSGKF